MATFVFVHGASHGGWCWERIVPLLENKNHTAIAPDLIGMGQDSTPVTSVSRQSWVDQITDIVNEQAENVVLVGHSRGGLIISEVAERIPARIEKLVYLTALLLPNGAIPAETMAQSGATTGENPPMLIEGDTARINPSRVEDIFYNCTEPAWVERAASLVCTEPMEPFLSPLKLTEENFGQVARVYIECLQDNALLIDTQREMYKSLRCDQVFSIDTDHSPFYSAPEQLAEILFTLV